MPTSKKHTAIEREKLKSKLKLPPDMHRGTLIIAPLGLIHQWNNEISAKTDKGRLRTLIHHGAGRTRNGGDFKSYDVVITTPQVLVSEFKDNRPDAQIGCFGIKWWRVVVDEAQGIKNHLAKATIACCHLEARHRWCLSGTPLQNNVDELQSLIHFLRVEPYADKAKWKQDISRLMAGANVGLAIERIQLILKAIMLRRTKAVLQAAANAKPSAEKKEAEKGQDDEKPKKTLKLDMVERKVKTVSCRFDEDEQGFYQRLETRMDARLNDLLFGSGKQGGMAGILVIMMRLRQGK
jgi:SNF2 family DNA or RNA helicase